MAPYQAALKLAVKNEYDVEIKNDYLGGYYSALERMYLTSLSCHVIKYTDIIPEFVNSFKALVHVVEILQETSSVQIFWPKFVLEM